LAENEYFHYVNPVASPLLFWHAFPPSSSLDSMFVHATKAKAQAHAKGKAKMAGKGNVRRDIGAMSVDENLDGSDMSCSD